MTVGYVSVEISWSGAQLLIHSGMEKQLRSLSSFFRMFTVKTNWGSLSKAKILIKFMCWWCSGILSGFLHRRSGVQFHDPPT